MSKLMKTYMAEAEIIRTNLARNGVEAVVEPAAPVEKKASVNFLFPAHVLVKPEDYFKALEILNRRM
jgi:hypothetical protein